MKADPLPIQRVGFCCGCKSYFGTIYLVAPWRYRCAACGLKEQAWTPSAGLMKNGDTA